MALPSLAPVSALEVRLGVEIGSLEDEDFARAEAAIADASTLVRSEAGRTWVAEDDSVTAPDDVVAVVLRAARREFQNPSGLRSESVGDYSYSLAEGGGVFLTDAERRIVRAAAGSGSRSVATPAPFERPETPAVVEPLAGEGWALP